MKTRKKNLNNLLEYLLNEDVPVQVPTNSQQITPPTSDVMMNTSLDQNVDRYLVRYEREAIPLQGTTPEVVPMDGMMATEGTRSRSLKTLFLEQDTEELDLGDEDEDLDIGDEGEDLDLGGDDDLDFGGGDEGFDAGGGFDFGGGGGGGSAGGGSGGDGEAGPAQPVMATPQININEFARAVARLVSNYDALLDPRSTILNRAKLYIQTNYDERMAQELMQILDMNYQLVPNQVSHSNVSQPEEFPTPYAVGAAGGG